MADFPKIIAIYNGIESQIISDNDKEEIRIRLKAWKTGMLFCLEIKWFFNKDLRLKYLHFMTLKNMWNNAYKQSQAETCHKLSLSCIL